MTKLIATPIHRYIWSLMVLVMLMCTTLFSIYLYQSNSAANIEKRAYAFHLKTASVSADALESLATLDHLHLLSGLAGEHGGVSVKADKIADDFSEHATVLAEKISEIVELDARLGESQFFDLMERLRSRWRNMEPILKMGRNQFLEEIEQNRFDDLRTILHQLQRSHVAEYESEKIFVEGRNGRIALNLSIFLALALLVGAPLMYRIFGAINRILLEKTLIENQLLEKQRDQAQLITVLDTQLDEIKKLDKVKNEFVSTVSHELRTPMTSIRGALGLIIAKFSEGLDDKVRMLLDTAERNAERLGLLINDILDFEKLQSGQMKMEFGPVDLTELARQAMHDNAGYALKNDVKMSLNVIDGVTTVRGDRHRLLQVYANLISNAIKFSPPQGNVEIRVLPRGHVVRAEITDHGQGIAEDFRSRIFQRFSQADSSDSRQKGGTGLGLSITKAIVEQHGGRVGFVSELGVGTTFQFDIPAWSETVPNAAFDQNAVARVLICEDNPDIAKVLAEMVRPYSLDCDIAYTIKSAKELLNRRRYMAMLLDLTLPDGEGLQLLNEIRAHEITRDLPVIIITGRSKNEQSGDLANGIHIVDWLQKPVKNDQLKAALAEAVKHTPRPRILHIEDDSDIIQLVRELVGHQADILSVPSIAAARSALQTGVYDLFILDLALEDGSGLEMLDDLKGRGPVVIFSASAPSREVTHSVAAYLTKSMTSNNELMDTLLRILKTSTALVAA